MNNNQYDSDSIYQIKEIVEQIYGRRFRDQGIVRKKVLDKLINKNPNKVIYYIYNQKDYLSAIMQQKADKFIYESGWVGYLFTVVSNQMDDYFHENRAEINYNGGKEDEGVTHQYSGGKRRVGFNELEADYEEDDE